MSAYKTRNNNYLVDNSKRVFINKELRSESLAYSGHSVVPYKTNKIVRNGWTYIFNNKIIVVDCDVIKFRDYYYDAAAFVEHFKLKKVTKKTNFIGIELEFLANKRWNEIRDELGKSDTVSIGEDCSVVGTCPCCGSDEIDGCEARLLTTEVKFKDDLKSLLNTLSKYKPYVNDACGLHIHFDMRNRDVEKSFFKFLKKQDDMFNKCEDDRRDGEYSAELDEDDFIDGAEFGSDCSWDDTHHYDGINAGDAYRKHKTIEIRMHEGTMNYNDIVEWIEYLLGILNG